ncbi:MAG: hypothetical protein IEMM0001_2239 [bacterium]|nr:MAG: hypothetical protein IEMM0001_2239 [bacterium]
MHKMTFFLLGNADGCRIDLECAGNILFGDWYEIMNAMKVQEWV